MSGWRCAISHTVSPILGEAVVFSGRGQTTVGHRQPHGNVGSIAAYVVPPQGRHGLLDAAFTCRNREKSV